MEAVYDYTVASLNRAVPVVIAVYRYLHVFSGNQFMDKHHKKKVQMCLLAYALGKITMNQWPRVFSYIFSGSSLSSLPTVAQPQDDYFTTNEKFSLGAE